MSVQGDETIEQGIHDITIVFNSARGEQLGTELFSLEVIAVELSKIGDIYLAQEVELVKEYGDELEVDVLVAPHHGNELFSSGRFIDEVYRDYVVIPSNRMSSTPLPAKAKGRGVLEVRMKELRVRFDEKKAGKEIGHLSGLVGTP